jgi:hypothetical protein
MKVQATNKQGQIIVDFVSDESRNIATNEAICRCYAQCASVFAVYVDGVLDCFSETSDKLAFPKTI